MKVHETFAGLLVAALFVTVGPVQAQSLQDRIKNVRKQQQREVALVQFKAAQKMAKMVPTVSMQEVSAKEAFEWLQVAGGVTIVVNWNSMAALGIDPHSEVRLITEGLTVGKAIDVLAQQLSPDAQLIVEPTPWYVEVMTKEMANRRAVTLVYPIGDLLHEIPHFTEAPEFDLAAVSGGTGGGGGTLFGDSGGDEKGLSKREHAEQIAQLIRDTVEPDIWRSNGGLAGSIAIYKESLVIRAPAYVHRQVGGVSPTPSGAGPQAAGLGAAAPARKAAPLPRGRLNPNLLAAKRTPKAIDTKAIGTKGNTKVKGDANTNTGIHATNTAVPVPIVKPDSR